MREDPGFSLEKPCGVDPTMIQQGVVNRLDPESRTGQVTNVSNRKASGRQELAQAVFAEKPKVPRKVILVLLFQSACC